MENPCSLVRSTAEWVLANAASVALSGEAIDSLVHGMPATDVEQLYSLKSFDTDLHYCDLDNPEQTSQYLLTVDALNYCFWPDNELEYAQLAGGVKRAVLQDPTAIDAARLAGMTEEGVQQLLRWPRPLPLAAERARLLREVGAALLDGYAGSAAELVRSAGGSAVQLVRLVTAAMPGFWDHSVYRGRQVFFYKRAQIFVGDLYGAFQGQGLGAFHDIEQLTMFADYRVPALLRELGVLRYSRPLQCRIEGQEELAPGSEEEVELRAATVVAVERIREAVATRRGPGAGAPNSVAVDWWLWEWGEAQRAQHRPHHRTLTIYY